MTEMTREWLITLFKNELEEVSCAISNEKLWQLGSTSEDDAWQHGYNVEQLEDYSQTLTMLCKVLS